MHKHNLTKPESKPAISKKRDLAENQAELDPQKTF